MLTAMCAAPAARADGVCDGPAECCPKEQAARLERAASVAVGVAFLGLYNIDDKNQAWDADYYLYEAWRPAPGFTPQTEVVNETNRQSSQFDETFIRDGRCVRSRRIHSTLHSRYDLRLFPFDKQHLLLKLSDAERDSTEVVYDAQPYVLGLDDDARTELPSWQVARDPTFTVRKHSFSFERGSPAYDYAVIDIAVKRRIEFYLTRFFLPLLLIVAVAFTVFWIHPEDLGSQVGIGVTCLLAVIAFQLGTASTLPTVDYLTFADRVYATCYFLIALAMIESIYSNTLGRRERHEEAERIDRISRVAFPIAAVLLTTLSAGLSLLER